MEHRLTSGRAAATKPTAAIDQSITAMATAKRTTFVRWVAALILFTGICATVFVASIVSSQNKDRLELELSKRAQQEVDEVLTRMKNVETGIRGTRGAILVGGLEHISAEAYRIYAQSRDLKTEFPGVRSFGFIRRDGDREILQFVSTETDDSTAIGLDIASQIPLRDAAQAAMRSGIAAMTPSLAPFFGSVQSGTWCLVVLPVYRPHLPHGSSSERDAATIGWVFAVVDLDIVVHGIDDGEDIELGVEDITVRGVKTPLTTVGRLNSPSVVTATRPIVAQIYGRQWAFTSRAGFRFAASLHSTPPSIVIAVGALLSLLAGAFAGSLAWYLRRSAEVRSQQSLLASVVANASDAIIMESPAGTVLSWNKAAEVLFGYSAEEAVGKQLAELILAKDRAFEDEEILTRCADGLQVAPFDASRQRRDGCTVDVSITAAPVIGPGGDFVAVANTVRDISARKAAENELRLGLENLEREVERRTQRLRATERDLRAITDALPSMIGYWDKNGINRFANRAYQKRLGTESIEMTGMRLEDCLEEPLMESVRPYIQAALRGEFVTFEREIPADDDGPSTTLLVHYIPDAVEGDIRGFYVLMHDITALKQSQARLAESQAFLEQAGAISGVGGFRIDLRSGQQVWTRQTFKIYGIEGDVAPSAEELDKLMDPNVGARLWQAIRVASETGVGYDLEIPVSTIQGSSIWIRTIGVVEFEDGRPARVVGAIQDITERKSVEEALRMTSERFALAADAAGIGVWEWDLASNTLHWDDQMYRLYERTRSTHIIPLAMWSAQVHADDRQRSEEEMRAALASGKVIDSEFRITLQSGEIRHLRTAAKVQCDADGAPIRMVGIDFDITSRKAAENALIDSELKFRTLFELSPVGIALNDLQTGQFLQFNDALAAPTGYTREELLRMTYWDITPPRFHDQEVEQKGSLEQTARYGPYEKEYLRKDGTVYAVLLSGISTRDASGHDVIWSIVQDISLRKAMESELAEAARRDKLTGLANRALFMERLEKAVTRVNHRVQPYFAVLFLDFDRFKLINDTLGHEAGDELLRQISRRLRGVLRASDALIFDEAGNVVSRFGGDEFLLLINDLKAPHDAVRMAERLLNALAPPYDIQGSEVHSSASIGIITSDQCRSNAEEVVRNADVAMYEAKRAGRACSVVFNEAMHTRLTRHVAIENSLRRAIGTAELSLVYQPIVDLNTRQMVSAEALLRWNHPTLGVISPAEFIPIAEETGLIVALGQWVQNEACRAMVDWRNQDIGRAPATISVNLSRAELALGQRLLGQLRNTLERHGLPAHCLQLEITEREIMRHPEAAHALMIEIQELGIQLAMDDFGTGTSSLGFLRNYPFNTIKIDRSFVQDVTVSGDVLAVIHATVNLIENLGMASLAEGVEEAGQVAILQSLGCRFAQGYYFSRPVPPNLLLNAIGMRAAAFSLQDI